MSDQAPDVSLSTGGLPPRNRLAFDVVRILRSAILSGQLTPGMRLAPQKLAAQFGVSSMPIREALIALTHESLIEALPRRGFRVAFLRIRDIEHTFRVHAQIAGLVAEEAAGVIQDADVGALHEIQRRIDAVFQEPLTPRGAEQVDALNLEFHKCINHVPDAPRLRWFLRAATGYVARDFYKDIPDWYSAAVRGHHEIIGALAAHDGASARSLIERHVLESGRVLTDALASRPPWVVETGFPNTPNAADD